eukprot:CAMPEP_0169080946 /NCGR_PEP_ID=MMETSP1015-20121227/10750_1 /TAXON_ID=342587 /ORGANISM="Karlodinium micrum, Strain CCMP2283" /LENGTH=148 /DNA_ID=CAMNT_0009140705 /DNA_START=543 /DNA_END=991 /DNA_ORIENTATION=+
MPELLQMASWRWAWAPTRTPAKTWPAFKVKDGFTPPSLEPTEEGVHTSLGRLLSPQLVETVVLLEHEAALQMERPEDRLLGTSGGLHGLFKPGREDAEEFQAVPGRATTRGAAARGVKGVAAYLPGCTDGSPLGCEDDYAADCSDDSH